MSDRSPRRILKSAVLAVLRALDHLTALLFLVVAWPLCLLARVVPKRFDIGLGPEPLINNVYHKRALQRLGYSVETFVNQVFFITSDFDYRADRAIPRPLFFLRGYWLFFRAIFRYRCLYIYFNGGPLMFRPIAWRFEPLLYRTAGVRVVVMPYGGDVQEMTRSRNLLFKHAMSADYPDLRFRRRRIGQHVDLWTRWADHVISGVEWVDYMYHWDTLMLGHFSIDTEHWRLRDEPRRPGPIRVLHAPNHRNIKGTDHFIRAVSELQAEGVDVELVMLERVPNEVIRDAVADADIVADQLVVGWYAMFALEAMATGRPVLCYLREDLMSLYEAAELMRSGEMPIVNCEPLTVKSVLRDLVADAERRGALGRAGREFVLAHHSLDAVGTVFDRINRTLGILPSCGTTGGGQGACAA